MAQSIEVLFRQARQYAEQYPGVIDPQIRKEIFWVHLAHLINSNNHDMWLIEPRQGGAA